MVSTTAFDNGLSEAELALLTFVAEERAEAIAIVGKIVRHGYESWDPTMGRTPM